MADVMWLCFRMCVCMFDINGYVLYFNL